MGPVAAASTVRLIPYSIQGCRAVTCYAPFEVRHNGDYKPLFGGKAVHAAYSMELPCGQCIGCLQSRQRDWATRGYCESRMHEASLFLTVTYRDEWLPKGRSTCTRDMQLFVKRVRKKLKDVKFKYIACTEYGSEGGRPHGHFVFFGLDLPPDAVLHSVSGDRPLYTSEFYSHYWPMGHVLVGRADAGAVGYVAGYVVKKTANKSDPDAYTSVDAETGEVFLLERERLLVSKGVGLSWFHKWRRDCFPSGTIVIDGRPRSLPRYFVKQLEEWEQFELAEKKREFASLHAADATPERLAVREEVAVRRLAHRKLSA